MTLTLSELHDAAAGDVAGVRSRNALEALGRHSASQAGWLDAV